MGTKLESAGIDCLGLTIGEFMLLEEQSVDALLEEKLELEEDKVFYKDLWFDGIPQEFLDEGVEEDEAEDPDSLDFIKGSESGASHNPLPDNEVIGYQDLLDAHDAALMELLDKNLAED